MALVMSVLWVPYTVAMLARTGTTLGKRIVGLRVRTTNGARLDYRRAFRREIWRVVFAAAIIWPIDYLAAMGRHRMTIHDRWSETTVVRSRSRARVLLPTLSIAGLFVVAAGMQYLSHYLERT
jgi:uncharacterized RDD family membrane protein YckC